MFNNKFPNELQGILSVLLQENYVKTFSIRNGGAKSSVLIRFERCDFQNDSCVPMSQNVFKMKSQRELDRDRQRASLFRERQSRDSESNVISENVPSGVSLNVNAVPFKQNVTGQCVTPIMPPGVNTAGACVGDNQGALLVPSFDLQCRGNVYKQTNVQSAEESGGSVRETSANGDDLSKTEVVNSHVGRVKEGHKRRYDNVCKKTSKKSANDRSGLVEQTGSTGSNGADLSKIEVGNYHGDRVSDGQKLKKCVRFSEVDTIMDSDSCAPTFVGSESDLAEDSNESTDSDYEDAESDAKISEHDQRNSKEKDSEHSDQYRTISLSENDKLELRQYAQELMEENSKYVRESFKSVSDEIRAWSLYDT